MRPLLYGGALLGLTIAIALELWRQQAIEQAAGEQLEGIWLTAADRFVRLGFPVNIVTILSLDALSPIFARLRLDPFFVLLLGIVVNWTMIGAVTGRLIRRRRH